MMESKVLSVQVEIIDGAPCSEVSISVSDAYETGRVLLEAGVVPGGDMTPEVRLRINDRCTKLMIGFLSRRISVHSRN